MVGRDDGVLPSHLVGAIANEAGLDGRDIGRIQVYDKHSTVELPRGMPRRLLQHLQKVRIFQKPLAIRRDTGEPPVAGKPGFSESRPKDRPGAAQRGRSGKGAKLGGKSRDSKSKAHRKGKPSR
jgi:ATP-dependent RNA helicase DeaD